MLRPPLHSPATPSPPGAVSLFSVLRWACAHPINLFVHRWNWKSAVFSALFRGLIFFTLNLKAGWRAAVGAMLAEFVWRTATSGGWGAATQMLCSVRPMWQALFGSMFVVPLVGHTLEFVIHYTRGTPVLAKSILVSICFTQISDLFNLYVMSNGAMLVGDGARPFGEDMRRVPALTCGFLRVLPRVAIRNLAGLPPPPGTVTIMEIAGHVSSQMFSRYSHIRMEAKRKALAEVDRQRAADKAQRENGRATAQATRGDTPVANVAQTLPIQ